MIREKLIFKIFVEAPICPIEALDFISAHETATGVSMDQIQKDAICGFVSRLQGNDTTNGSDLWTALVNRGSYIWPLTPSSDSVASANGYSIELISQTQIGSYINFISTDITPNGVNPNSSNIKRFDTNIFPTTLPSDSSLGVYNRTDVSSSEYNGARESDGDWFAMRVNTNAVAINTTTINQTTGVTRTGLQIAQRVDNSNSRYIVNGVVTANYSNNFSSLVNRDIWFHLRNLGTLFVDPLSKHELAMYMVDLPQFNTNELADFYEAVQWYQTNVITGGRQV